MLCNPFPIFPEHFTISSLRHTPQLIRDSFRRVAATSPGNWARVTRCCTTGRDAAPPRRITCTSRRATGRFLPIDAEYEALKKARATRLFESDSFRAYSIENYLRRFITFESPDAGLLQRAFGALYEVFQEGGPAGEEPMLNILGFYTNGEWRIHFFPRAKHRPSFYFKEGDEKLLISPAAVELGGICTTPREQDFEKVTREHIVEMYQEVCVSAERFAAIKARLAPKLAALASAPRA